LTQMIKGKVAIIHDWLNGMRGGEKVLEEILEIFPAADIHTLFYEPKNVSPKIKSHRVVPSSLNKYKWIRKRYKAFLPFFPAAIEEFNLKAYDLIISSSHCVAKGIIPHPHALHISYLHSPMRYIWDQYYAYFGNTFGVKKYFIKKQISKLRTWDVSSASRVDYFIANSNFVRSRIWRYYRREAEVIHPPVDTDFFKPALNPQRNYFLCVSALVPYKKVCLLVEAFNQSGQPLIIVGKGSEEKNLKKLAEKNIEFKQNVSAEELRSLYQNAIAYVYGGIEDFGISFVESIACGTPVIAYKKGGVMDIIKPKTGILYDHQSVKDIVKATRLIQDIDYESSYLHEESLRFSRQAFRNQFKSSVQEKL